MINQLIVFKPPGTKYGKVFFPEHIIQRMGWDIHMGLRIMPLINDMSISIQRDMSKESVTRHSQLRKEHALRMESYYVAPFVFVPPVMKIKKTLPVVCSYLISSASYPERLIVMFPGFLLPH